jgi:1,4-alpha-glucan branching enzyme
MNIKIEGNRYTLLNNSTIIHTKFKKEIDNDSNNSIPIITERFFKNNFIDSEVISSKIENFEKMKLNVITLIAFRVINSILSTFFNLQIISNSLSRHDHAIKMQQSLKKFTKLDLNNLNLPPIYNLALSYAVDKKEDAEVVNLIYKSCKYLKTLHSLEELSIKLNSLLKNKVQPNADLDFITAFNKLPKNVRKIIFQVVCLSQNKQTTNLDFASNELNKDPTILAKILNENQQNIIEQLAVYYRNLHESNKDLALIKQYKYTFDGDSKLATDLIEELSERTQMIIQTLLSNIPTTDNADHLSLIDKIERTIQIGQIDHIKKNLKSLNIEKSPISTVYDTSIERIASEFSLSVLNEPITVAMVGVEFSGLLKQGGLAEALEGITQGIKDQNPQNKARLIFPKYNKLPSEIVQQLKKTDQIFISDNGQEISVYSMNLHGVECFFIEDEAFNLSDKNPNIYGLTEEDNKKKFITFSGKAANVLHQMKGNDVIHLHDWHVAGIALKLNKEHRQDWEEGKIPPIVFTFHNNNRSAQGRTVLGAYNYDPVVKSLQEHGLADVNSNIFAEVLNICDMTTTVSKTFATEAQLPELGEGASFAVREAAKVGKLVGIINGTNTTRWNPEIDKNLKEWKDPKTGEPVDLSFGSQTSDVYEKKMEAKKQLAKWVDKYLEHGRQVKGNPKKTFKFDPDKPFISYIGRFDSYQKGLDKLDEAIASTLKNGGQFVLMGSQEDPISTKILQKLERKYPQGVLFIRDFKNKKGKFHFQEGDAEETRAGIGSIVRAASDFLYVPSRYEPCGLVQFEGWLFGSQAIGSNTGGLADTIITKEKDSTHANGYIFNRGSSSSDSAHNVVKTALKDWYTVASATKNETAKRILTEGKLYSWNNAPIGFSPTDKYRFIYKKAKQRVILRHQNEIAYKFDLNEHLHATKVNTKPSKVSRETKKEEEYLHEYYFGKKTDEELEKLYFSLPVGLRAQLPIPYTQRVKFDAYNQFGAKVHKDQLSFNVYASKAKTVSVRLYADDETIKQEIPMIKQQDGSWQANMELALSLPNQKYHYIINGKVKIDPYGTSHVYSSDKIKPPYSVVPSQSNDFVWNDKKWIQDRIEKAGKPQPISIYEMHPTAWKRKEDGGYLTYKELGDELVTYCKNANFTHIELMGILEHGFEGSMGYQVTGFFAPNSRLGSVEDFKYMINKLHENNISVILDWVPAHFAIDEYALKEFDGSKQFEPSFWKFLLSKRRAYRWGTKFFDYSKKDVREFLISSAMYWIKEMHIDGIRVDAVRCMLDSEDGAASKLFMRELNIIIHAQCKGAITIAEDYSGSKKITQSTHLEGLGFDMKWNVGWMHHVLDYFSRNPKGRQKNYQTLIHSIEGDKFHKMILALSHDEVKHGMKTLINKMPGINIEERYGNLRCLLSFMMAIPGKKLNFMGNEIASEEEWTSFLGTNKGLLNQSSSTNLTNEAKQTFEMFKTLNHLYRTNSAFWEKDDNAWDLTWLVNNDKNHSLIVYQRESKTDQATCLHNFAGTDPVKYVIPIDKIKGALPTVIFNSDDERFGGQTNLNTAILKAVYDQRENIIGYEVTVPALSTIIINS